MWIGEGPGNLTSTFRYSPASWRTSCTLCAFPEPNEFSFPKVPLTSICYDYNLTYMLGKLPSNFGICPTIPSEILKC